MRNLILQPVPSATAFATTGRTTACTTHHSARTLFLAASALAILGVCVTPSIAGSPPGGRDINDWPTFSHDNLNSGYSQAEAPDTNNLLWSYTTGGQVNSSPAIVDGKVYVGSNDTQLYCLDADNGSLLWSYDTGGIVTASPTVYNGNVYFGSGDDYLYCLNATTGAYLWSYEAGGNVHSPTVYSWLGYVDAGVFFGSDDNNLYCLDAATGSFIWSYYTGGDVESCPAVTEWDWVYFGSKDNKMYCLDAYTGEFIWSYTGTSDACSPTVAEWAGHMWYVESGGELHYLDEDDGHEYWAYLLGGGGNASPALWNDRVYVGANWESEKLHCLNTGGSVLWSSATDDSGRCSPAVADGKVYIGSQGDNRLYCFDALTGDEIWNYQTGGQVRSSPAISDGRVYVGAWDNKLYCFGDPPVPTACFEWSDADGAGEGLVIAVDASCSTDDLGIVQYEWDWTDDGVYDESQAEPTATHDYGDCEEWTCRVRVTNTGEQTDTVTHTVQASGCVGDCNGNGIDDSCDLDCGEVGGPCDVPGCGLSSDCQPNGIPDECDIAAQEEKLLAGDGAADDHFGYSVGISGDAAVIGAAHDDDNGSDSGAAYVFRYNGWNWPEQKLTASDGAADDRFGLSAAISGDVAVIGAHPDVYWSGLGAAYVFRHSDSVWGEETKLESGGGSNGDWFGHSVAIVGNRVLVGAPLDSQGSTWVGAAYVFRYEDGVGWVQEQKLQASGGQGWDEFGWSVSLSGNVALIGSFADDDNGSASGSAYVFRHNGSSWVQEQKLLASDGAEGDNFGYFVSISGNTALIGSHRDDDNGTDSGSAYVFHYNGSIWVEQQKLTASDAAAGDSFGWPVAVDGDTAIIGAYGNDDNGTGSGSAYVFRYDPAAETWLEEAKITASDAAEGDHFGYCVAISGDTAIVGAAYDDDNGTNSGSAYTIGFPSSVDCNSNDVPDECDIADGTSADCNSNDVPDECDIADGTSADCNSNDVPDECDIADGTSQDDNGNGIPDECEIPSICTEPPSETALTPTCEEGEDAPDQTFEVWNCGGGGTLEYAITVEYQPPGDNWILPIDPPDGTSEGEHNTHTVHYITASLACGDYSATITISDPNATNNPQTIPVELTVTGQPSIGLDTYLLTNECQEGEDVPDQTFEVCNAGKCTLDYTVTVNYVPPGDNWILPIEPPSGTLGSGDAPVTHTVSYTTAGLACRSAPYQATITISDPEADNDPQIINVELTVLCTYMVGGTIFDDCADPSGSGVGDILVTVEGDGGTFTTYSSAVYWGTWQIYDVPCGTYTVTPSTEGLAFCDVETLEDCPPDPCYPSRQIIVSEENEQANQNIMFLAMLPPMGACCFSPTGCVDLTEGDCDMAGGFWEGLGTECGVGGACEGACCLSSGGCLELVEADCDVIPDTAWQGFGTDCTDGNDNGTADDCEPPGDMNGDGDVDLDDYALFAGCLTGPGGGIDPGCELADLDDDTDVDLADFEQWSLVLTGPSE